MPFLTATARGRPRSDGRHEPGNDLSTARPRRDGDPAATEQQPGDWPTTTRQLQGNYLRTTR